MQRGLLIDEKILFVNVISISPKELSERVQELRGICCGGFNQCCIFNGGLVNR